jgi:hypothetical protein
MEIVSPTTPELSPDLNSGSIIKNKNSRNPNWETSKNKCFYAHFLVAKTGFRFKFCMDRQILFCVAGRQQAEVKNHCSKQILSSKMIKIFKVYFNIPEKLIVNERE